ncbi:MAG: hypothetical protein HQL57_00475 [Magnetococcales bacterium]|nr:hypothetical protein [Magnetococcales bacterium]
MVLPVAFCWVVARPVLVVLIDMEEKMAGQMEIDVDGWLEEGNLQHDLLFKAYWGEEEGRCRQVVRLARSLENSVGSMAILVSGGFGTGKSTFMRQLQEVFVENEKEYEGGKSRASQKNTPKTETLKTETLWLHMPVISAQRGVPADLAVLAATVDHLCGEKGASGQCGRLIQALDDLYKVVTGNGPVLPKLGDPNAKVGDGLAGTRSAIRNSRTRTINRVFQTVLEERGQRLVLFLDDIDRCPSHVPVGLVKLLLLFMNGQPGRVHFVMASREEVMRHGVEEWMRDFGQDHRGNRVVTPNSALEKYLHFHVELPSLGDRLPNVPEYLLAAFPGEKGESLKRHCGKLREEGRKLGAGGASRQSQETILGEVFFAHLLSQLDESQYKNESQNKKFSRGASLPGSLGSARKENAAETRGAEVEEVPRERGMVPAGGGQVVGQNGKVGVAAEVKGVIIPESMNLEKIFEEKKAGFSDEDKMLGLNLFGTRLVELVEFNEEKTRLCFGFSARFRKITKYLTPRQFKYFIRSHLLVESYSAGDQGFAFELLSQIAPTFADLKKENRAVFEDLCRVASFLMNGEWSQREAHEIFLRRLNQRLWYDNGQKFEKDTSGDERCYMEDSGLLCRHWPASMEERQLLMMLLQDEYEYRIRNGVRMSGEPSGGSSGERDGTRVGRTGEGRAFGSEGSEGGGDGGSRVNLDEVDREFLDFAKREFGSELRGKDLNEWISDFQDRVSAKYNRGEDHANAAVSIVRRYMDNFWESQVGRFVGNSGISLSNLAVTIEDKHDLSHYCDMLFGRALEVTPGHIEIAAYHAEFLVKAADSSVAREGLIRYRRYDSPNEIHGEIRRLISYHQVMPRNVLRKEIIMLYLSYLEGGEAFQIVANRINEFDFFSKILIATLGKREIVSLFVSGSYDYDREVFSVVANYLDHIFSSGEGSLLLKGMAGAWLWSQLEKGGTPDRPVPVSCLASMLGNHFAGESEDGSAAEFTGLALDLGVLQDPMFLETNPGYSSAVMTQAAVILCKIDAKRASSEGASMALFYLASSRFNSDESKWQSRLGLCLRRRKLSLPDEFKDNLSGFVHSRLPKDVRQSLESLVKIGTGGVDREFCQSLALWFKQQSSEGGIFSRVSPIVTLSGFLEALKNSGGEKYQAALRRVLSSPDA